VAEHSFQTAVKALQDADIAEFNNGFISADTHLTIERSIEKIAMAGKDLDSTLATANVTNASIKVKLDAIYTLLDDLNNNGFLGVKNPTAKASLEIALDTIKTIIDNALVQVTP